MTLFDNVQTGKHLREREDLANIEDDWLVDTLIPASQAGILVAPFKSYKSSLAMHISLTVSQGLPFFGYRTKKSKTLYIDNEDTDRELNKRLRKKDEVTDDIEFLTGGQFRLDSVQHMRDLTKYIEVNQIKFVVFDNLMTMLANGDVIYSKEFRPLLDRITKMKLYFQDVTFLLIAHAQKAEYSNSVENREYRVKPDKALGGSDLTGWAEYMLMLSPKVGRKNEYSKLTVKARGYAFEDDLNFSYVEDEFTCVNMTKKDLPHEINKETEQTGEQFLETMKAEGIVNEITD